MACPDIDPATAERLIVIAGSVARATCRQTEAAYAVEDAASDALVGILAHMDKAGLSVIPDGLAATIGKRAIVDSWRRRNGRGQAPRGESVPLELAAELQDSDWRTSPDAWADANDIGVRVSLLVQAIQTLPMNQQRIIHEIWVAGRTYDDVGRDFGVSSSRIYRIHEQIKTRLRVYLESVGAAG